MVFFQPRGIYVHAELSDEDTESIRIHFKTKLRVDHYFMSAGFLIVFVSILFSGDISRWVLVWVLILWVIVTLWFQMFFRAQENDIINKVISKLTVNGIPNWNV